MIKITGIDIHVCEFRIIPQQLVEKNAGFMISPVRCNRTIISLSMNCRQIPIQKVMGYCYKRFTESLIPEMKIKIMLL